MDSAFARSTEEKAVIQQQDCARAVMRYLEGYRKSFTPELHPALTCLGRQDDGNWRFRIYAARTENNHAINEVLKTLGNLFGADAVITPVTQDALDKSRVYITLSGVPDRMNAIVFARDRRHYPLDEQLGTNVAEFCIPAAQCHKTKSKER